MLTPEQLAMRMNGVCSSDVPAMADLLPKKWKNRRGPEDLLAEKLGEVAPWEGNARTKKGDKAEPIIARLWSERTGRPVRRNSQTVPHAKHPEWMATVDYETEDDGSPVECKLVGFFVGKDWVAGPPDYVLAQLQWQLGVLGRPVGHVAAWIEGFDSEELVETWPVEFEPATFERLTFLATRFWQRVMEARAAKERHVSHG
jgi:putative phage-type endonuclease